MDGNVQQLFKPRAPQKDFSSARAPARRGTAQAAATHTDDHCIAPADAAALLSQVMSSPRHASPPAGKLYYYS